MSQGKITKDKVSEKDPFEYVSLSAKEAKAYVDALELSLKLVKEISAKLKNDLPKSTPTNNAELKKQNELFQEANDLAYSKIAIDKKLKESREIESKNLGELTDRITRITAARSVLLAKTREAAKLAQQDNVFSKKAIGLTIDEEKELADLSKQLFLAQKERVSLNKANSDSLKNIKDVIDLESKQLGTIEKITIQSRVLRNEQKKLNLETAEGKKRNIEINEQLNKNTKFLKENLDAFSVNKIGVGGYTEAIKEALDGTKEISGQFGATSESVEKLVPGFEGAAGGVKGLGGAFKALLLNPIVAIIALIIGGVIALGKAFQGTKEGAFVLEKASAKLGASFDVLKGKLATLASEILDGKLFDKLKDSFNEFSDVMEKRGFFAALDNDLRKTAEGIIKLGNEVEVATKKAVEIVVIKNAFKEINHELIISIANLNKISEIQGLIASDDTKSFKVRENAANEARKASEEAAEAELKLAAGKRLIAEKEYEQQKRVNQLSGEDIEARIHAEEELINAQKNYLLVQIQNQQAIDKLRQDRLEKDIDALEKGFEFQKNINEKIISNEAQALLEREKLFKKTSILSEELFNDQVRRIENFAKISINQNDLINESDLILLNKKIRGLGLSESIEAKLLEAINKRKRAIQDLSDIEKMLFDFRLKQQELLEGVELSLVSNDFDKQIIQALKNSEQVYQQIDDLRKNDIISETEANKLREEENKRVESQINKIKIAEGKKRIDDAAALSIAEFDQRRTGFKTQEEFEKEKSKQLVGIKKKQLLDELDLLNKFGGEEAKLRKQQIKAELEGLNTQEKTQQKTYKEIGKSLEFTESLFEESYNKRQELINKEGEAHRKNLEEFKNAAREGNITAKESLAEEQQLAIEADRKAEELEKEKQRVLFVTSILKAYNAELSSGKTSGEALSNAIINTTVLEQFAKSLPAFIEGTENVGESLGKPQLSGRDGHIIRVDGDERIVDPENNRKYGGMSNDEAANIIERYRLGKMMDGYHIIGASNNVDTKLLESKLDDVKKAIINKPETDINIGEITQHSFMIIERKKQGNQVTTNRFKVKA